MPGLVVVVVGHHDLSLDDARAVQTRILQIGIDDAQAPSVCMRMSWVRSGETATAHRNPPPPGK